MPELRERRRLKPGAGGAGHGCGTLGLLLPACWLGRAPPGCAASAGCAGGTPLRFGTAVPKPTAAGCATSSSDTAGAPALAAAEGRSSTCTHSEMSLDRLGGCAVGGAWAWAAVPAGCVSLAGRGCAAAAAAGGAAAASDAVAASAGLAALGPGPWCSPGAGAWGAATAEWGHERWSGWVPAGGGRATCGVASAALSRAHPAHLARPQPRLCCCLRPRPLGRARGRALQQVRPAGCPVPLTSSCP